MLPLRDTDWPLVAHLGLILGGFFPFSLLLVSERNDGIINVLILPFGTKIHAAADTISSKTEGTTSVNEAAITDISESLKTCSPVNVSTNVQKLLAPWNLCWAGAGILSGHSRDLPSFFFMILEFARFFWSANQGEGQGHKALRLCTALFSQSAWLCSEPQLLHVLSPPYHRHSKWLT